MKDWKVLGAPVAIVKEGKVILSKGYGLRDVKGNLPVTEQTLFPIASITKSFTVATLGTLATEANGRFARLHDPEGNPIELWQPNSWGL